MAFNRKTYEVLDRFNFEIQPVGIKFSPRKPEGVEKLAGTMAFCEMLKHAQEGNSFFADVKNHTCEAGSYVLGQAEAVEPFINGEFGAELKIFEDTRSASRLYEYIPKLERGTVNYVSFSPLDKLSFDPDLILFLAKTHQTEILLRAMSFRTGKMWSSKYSPAIGCAWIYVYPYLTGELNYAITGLGHGMRRRNLFQEGQQLISIPFDLIPSVLDSLVEMPWVLPAYKPDGLDYVKKLLKKLGVNLPSP